MESMRVFRAVSTRSSWDWRMSFMVGLWIYSCLNSLLQSVRSIYPLMVGKQAFVPIGAIGKLGGTQTSVP